jgi:glucose-1-phosphate cytidylyltransferase
MKVLIFCGGFGTRMNNGEPGLLKPLIEVAGKEILAHIISIYESQNISNFILLGGYRVEDLYAFAKKYTNTKLKITVLNTGNGTPTGGRLLQAKALISNGPFLLTYGDSLANFNLSKAKNTMLASEAEMSISTFKKKLEYGILDVDSNFLLNNIFEKTYSVPINAGFYILNPNIFDYIYSLNESFEIDVLPRLIKDKKIKISVCEVDFWHPMDTPDDKSKLSMILTKSPNILFEDKN